MKKSSLDPLYLQFSFCVFIAVSAVFILFPDACTIPYVKQVPGFMAFVLFVFMIRKNMTTGAHKLTPKEMYLKAKSGEKFAPSALELAAFVSVMIASWKTM